MGHNDHADDFDDELDGDPPDWKLADLAVWSDWLLHAAEINELMSKETPRGAAVLARAYLEEAIETAFLTAAINDPNRREEFARNVSKNFPDKIDAWASYTRLEPRVRSAMHCLRNLGDAFAHHPRASSFDEKSIAPLMRKLDEVLDGESSPPDKAGGEIGKMRISLALQNCIAKIVRPPWLLEAEPE